MEEAAADPILRVLIIDHYDSYTNNILQILHKEHGGGDRETCNWIPVIIKYDQFTWSDFRKTVLPHFDAIILSPGPGRTDNEDDFGFGNRLIQEADIPILGVCLGLQGIGTAFGAKIVHAPRIRHGQVSQICHTGHGLFEGLNAREVLEGVQYNSLILDETSVPNMLQVTAWTHEIQRKNANDPEPRSIAMGLQHVDKPIHGVQWHPESVCSSHGREIITNFARIVKRYWFCDAQRMVAYKERHRDTARLDSIFSHRHDNLSISKKNHGTSLERAVCTPSPAFQIRSLETQDGPTPDHVFEHLNHDIQNAVVWLDSARNLDENSRFSYLANGSFCISYSTITKRLQLYQNGQTSTKPIKESFWEWLDGLQRLIHRRCGMEDVLTKDLQAGFIGYLGYEMKRESLPGYTFGRSEFEPVNDDMPDSQLLFAQSVLRYDHFQRTWRISGLVRTSTEDPISDLLDLQQPVGFESVQAFDDYVATVRQCFQLSSSIALPKRSLPRFQSTDSRSSYLKSISAAKSAIKEGNSYEMTLTTKFCARSDEPDTLSIYRGLRARNPAPYSAYMHFPATDTTIMSSSPERFISITADGLAEMKPIKGTLAVSKDPQEDARRIRQLGSDVKELAENLMIVDLIRSDLHNISPSHTITVPKLMQVESYATVHQLVTTIRSQLRPSVSPVEAIKSVFPPGSMTGAPKLRSVQILDRLERDQERGPYSGCLGYISVSGAVDMSVVIRTIVKHGNEMELGAGGAITWLSDPEQEWQEVLTKAGAVADLNIIQSRADSLEPDDRA